MHSSTSSRYHDHSVVVNTLYKDLLYTLGLSRTIRRLCTLELVGYVPVQLKPKRLKVNPAIGSSHQQISWLITILFPITLLAPLTNSSQGLFLNCTHFGLSQSHQTLPLLNTQIHIWYICTWKAAPASSNRVRFWDSVMKRALIRFKCFTQALDSPRESETTFSAVERSETEYPTVTAALHGGCQVGGDTAGPDPPLWVTLN